jgi:preprotein translocase subunit SecE
MTVSVTNPQAGQQGVPKPGPQKPGSTQPGPAKAAGQGKAVRFDLVRYFKDVRAEAMKVTWPSRRNTLITTGAVVAMAALTSIFFFIVDQVIGLGVRELFGVGG